MTSIASNPLPALQAGWMSELLDGPIPGETRATCDDCAMCKSVVPGTESFNAETKCCTYLPVLPNFLVGQILADDDAGGEAGRESVRARIASGVAVTPLGLGIPPSYGLLYHHGGPRVFGHIVSMRCPHYIEDGGRCGIWRHRNAVCATWFCKHDRGAVGSTFWDSVRELLSAIELELARACLLELDVGASAIERALPTSPRPGMESFPVSRSELDGRGDAVAAATRWGSWATREIAFYRACASFVGKLDFPRILGLCGQEVRLRTEVVRAAWRKLGDLAPPERLRLGPLLVLGTGPKTYVSAYSVHDPVEMPRELFALLHHFDGRRTEEARVAIAEASGHELTTGLVRKLTDFGVLVAATDETRT